MTNIDLCGIARLLRTLVEQKKTTEREARRILARIAAQTGADIFVPLVVLAGQRWNSREKSLLTPIWKSNSTNLRFRAILSAIATSWSVRSMIRILFLCHGSIYWT